MSNVAFPHDEYKAALREEKAIREEIFLDLPAKICGIRIQQITPFLFARLCAMDTPFLSGRDADEGEIIRFLWALSPDFSSDLHPKTPWYRRLLGKKRISRRDAFIRDAWIHLRGCWDEAEFQIDAFIRDTFIDAPRGNGGSSVPYVTGVAWMLYRMGREPFRWDKERTLKTPMREIYQYMRCQKIDNGGILYNEISDKIKARWLDELNAGGKN